MDYNNIQNDLISEIKLSKIEAQIFLLVVLEGRMTFEQISQKLDIDKFTALDLCKNLVVKGGFIDFSEKEFEAMHPRFTAVNMYRKMCEKENIEFKRNVVVDNIGVQLEKAYDAARTK